MDLRLELEAAHRRIAELEHQLEAYRKAEHVSMSGLTSNSTAQTTVFKSSVITRAAAAALKKSSGFDVKDVSMRRPKQLSKKLAPHATPAHCPPLQPKPHIPSSKFMHVQNPAQSLESITFDNATSKIDLKTRSKSMPKILRPAATIVHQRFSPSPAAVPLKPKLAIDKAKRVSSSTLQSNGKFASTNILSPVSTFSDDNNSTSSPSSSTNAKKVVVEVKSLPAKTAMRGGKSSKKERSTLVAKCTEPRAGQTRYWTQEEHERFLEAVAQYGEKAYVAISNYVETRTPKQVRTHAQKFQMKMARLARQSAETGEPLQLPPGMLPIVIEGVPKKKPVGSPMSDSMATDAEPGCSSESCDAEMASSTGADATAEESTEVSPATCGEAADVVGEAASSVSDVSCDDLTDPYLSYIGGDGEGCEKEGLEDCFAAKLSKTFQNGTMGMAVKGEILSLDEVGSIKTGRVEHDDDLEDLEDCGELPMASLSNFGI